MQRALPTLILLAFLVFVEWYVGWRVLLSPWRGQEPTSVLLALVLALCTYWLRAMRFYDYFRYDMRGAFGTCFKLTLQHNLFNVLLPMRTGELSFPVLMARYFGITMQRSLPALLWFRMLDLHTLGLFALVAVGLLWSAPAPVAFAAGLWVTLPWLAYRAGVPVQRRLAGGEGRIRGWIASGLEGLPQDTGAFARAWAWTLVNWAVKLAVLAWVLLLFVDAPASAAWLAAIGGDLTSVLPVHGVAGAGTYEAGVVAALLPFGVAPEPALKAAVNLHIFVLAATLLGGAVSVLLPNRVGR
jgi:uncharacterized membrane protein YbhN (UPF0104 family)